MVDTHGRRVDHMSLNIKIECLPEPKLIFGANETGVEPRRVMAKHGAADKSVPKELRIGIDRWNHGSSRRYSDGADGSKRDDGGTGKPAPMPISST